MNLIYKLKRAVSQLFCNHDFRYVRSKEHPTNRKYLITLFTCKNCGATHEQTVQ